MIEPTPLQPQRSYELPRLWQAIDTVQEIISIVARSIFSAICAVGRFLKAAGMEILKIVALIILLPYTLTSAIVSLVQQRFGKYSQY